MIWWLQFVDFLGKAKVWCKKAWIWTKSHGDIILVAAVAIIVSILTRKGVNLGDVIKSKKENYQAQIDAIENAHKEEIAHRDAALLRYQKAVEDIEKKHAEAQTKLDEKKKKKIKEAIEANADDPDEITRRIAEITGFSIHVE